MGTIPDKTQITGDVTEGEFQDAVNQLVDTLTEALGKTPSTTFPLIVSALNSLNASVSAINGDSRWTNSRSPTAHRSTHASGGGDALTAADINAVSTSDVTATATANKLLKLNADAKLPADIVGNSDTSTKIKVAKKINGALFDGTQDVFSSLRYATNCNTDIDPGCMYIGQQTGQPDTLNRSHAGKFSYLNFNANGLGNTNDTLGQLSFGIDMDGFSVKCRFMNSYQDWSSWDKLVTENSVAARRIWVSEAFTPVAGVAKSFDVSSLFGGSDEAVKKSSVEVCAICTTANNGYLVGDIINNVALYGTSSYPLAMAACVNKTTVSVAVSQAVLYVRNKSNGFIANVNFSVGWNLFIRIIY